MSRSYTLFTCLALLFAAPLATAQALSPGESLIIIPTASFRDDARLTIGYGQLPKQVSSPYEGFNPAGARDELYVITLQFIPRVSLHYRQSFKRADFPQATGDRVLGIHVTALKESSRIPGVAVGLRDAGGTRKHHATYIVATKGTDVGPAHVALTVGYSKQFLDAGFLEMKDGLFYGASMDLWNRVELMAEYDTRFYYAGARVWPVKWFWVSGFLAEWEHPGFSFGFSRVLKGAAQN
ncbi:MAG: YjbH domain-containing protein [Bacteroidetes bacterium]|nr:YjbH domain-containing protein [Bacteroidota bacterium]